LTGSARSPEMRAGSADQRDSDKRLQISNKQKQKKVIDKPDLMWYTVVKIKRGDNTNDYHAYETDQRL